MNAARKPLLFLCFRFITNEYSIRILCYVLQDRTVPIMPVSAVNRATRVITRTSRVSPSVTHVNLEHFVGRFHHLVQSSGQVRYAGIRRSSASLVTILLRPPSGRRPPLDATVKRECLSHDTTYFRIPARTLESML